MVINLPKNQCWHNVQFPCGLYNLQNTCLSFLEEFVINMWFISSYARPNDYSVPVRFIHLSLPENTCL